MDLTHTAIGAIESYAIVGCRERERGRERELCDRVIDVM